MNLALELYVQLPMMCKYIDEGMVGNGMGTTVKSGAYDKVWLNV